MAVESFKLFKLSLITLKEVFGEMDWPDVMNLSYCSQRAKKIIGNVNSGKDREVFVIVNQRVRVFMEEYKRGRRMIVRVPVITEGTEVPPIPENITAEYSISLQDFQTNENSVWPFQSFKEWFAHFQYIFDVKIIADVNFLQDFNPSFVLPVKEAIDGYKVELLAISPGIEGTKLVLDSDFKYKSLSFLPSSVTDPDVRRKLISSDLNKCALYGHITFDEFSTMNCKKCDIQHSELTNRELHRFLKNWTKGKHEKLEHLEIQLSDTERTFPIKEIYGGMRGGRTRQKERIEEFCKRNQKDDRFKELMIEIGMDVHRDDGKIATIFIMARTVRANRGNGGNDDAGEDGEDDDDAEQREDIGGNDEENDENPDNAVIEEEEEVDDEANEDEEEDEEEEEEEEEERTFPVFMMLIWNN